MHQKLISRLNEFLQLERDLRAAQTEAALGFIVVNFLKKLVNYDAAVWLIRGERDPALKVKAVSGVSDFDNQAPLVVLSESLCNDQHTSLTGVDVHICERLPERQQELAAPLQLNELVTVNVLAGRAVLVLIKSAPWQDFEQQLLQQVAEVVAHAQEKLELMRRGRRSRRANPWLRPGWRWVACGLVLSALIPIRHSVLASGEVVADSPTVIASGLEGVIEEVLVRPNERVRAGDVLLRFDDAELILQAQSIEKQYLLAEENLRKARQQSLNNVSAGASLSDLEAEVDLRRIEYEFVREQAQRLELVAPTDGIVLFSRTKDWEGRAVRPGEKIMELASDEDRQFEIWVDTQDAIGFRPGAEVSFFSDADPLSRVSGSVSQVSYFADRKDGDALAYRIVAKPAASHANVRAHEDGAPSLQTVHRPTKDAMSSDSEKTRHHAALTLGTRGTFRLYGERVLLGYHVLRRPIATVRRYVGV